jgi:hypothetical protein
MNDTTNDSSLRERFVQMVRDQVGSGIYVWGGNGEMFDDLQDVIRFVERHEEQEENVRRISALIAKRLSDGVERFRMFDCSGLVYWALHVLGLQKHDVSSRGLYQLCTKIEEADLMPGDLVFHHDGRQIVHVGISDGDEQIECRGRDVGVVRNRRKPGYWNRFGRLPAFGKERDHDVVLIRGGSVRVREGGGTNTRCLGIVHRGETYPLLGAAPSGWHRIAWNGRAAYITNKPQYTEVRHG